MDFIALSLFSWLVIIVFICVCIALGFSIYRAPALYKGYNSVRKIRLLSRIKSPEASSLLFGHVFDLPQEGSEFLKLLNSTVEEFRDEGIIKLRLISYPVCLIFSPKNSEILLKGHSNLVKGYSYEALQSWLAGGLLISHGEHWRIRRKQLTPAFHFNILNDFVTVFNTHADVLVRQLEKFVGVDQFDIFKVYAPAALDVICDTTMGKQLHAQEGQSEDYCDNIKTVASLILKRAKRPWLINDFVYSLTPNGRLFYRAQDKLHGYTRQVICERKAEFEAERLDCDRPKKKRLALLDLMLEMQASGESITDDHIKEQVDAFMFAGHDTTSAALTWCTLLLAAHPDIQCKVHEEIREVIGSEALITMDHLAKLRYTDCAIKEALRIFPSVPIIGRTLSEETNFENGYTVPAGVMVLLSISGLHMDPNVFPDPEKFDPTRWTSENSTTRNPYAYVPFSAGPRNCLGQKFAQLEEKVMIARVFRHYKVSLAKPLEEMPPEGEMSSRPHGGAWVRIEYLPD